MIKFAMLLFRRGRMDFSYENIRTIIMWEFLGSKRQASPSTIGCISRPQLVLSFFLLTNQTHMQSISVSPEQQLQQTSEKKDKKDIRKEQNLHDGFLFVLHHRTRRRSSRSTDRGRLNLTISTVLISVLCECVWVAKKTRRSCLCQDWSVPRPLCARHI